MPDDPLVIQFSFRLGCPVRRLTVETALRRSNGELLVSLNSRQQGVTFDAPVGAHKVSIHLPAFPLAAGNYFALVRLWDADRSRLLGETPHVFTLQVDDRGRGTGLVALPHHWSGLEPAEQPGQPVLSVAGA
jgi:hypothetical protein